MQCQILGPLRVIGDDGNDRTPGSAQQRRLLTLLAAQQPAAVSTDAIEDLLWPDGAPSTNALQALISKLRKVTTSASIEADGPGYALRSAVTDADEFARLVETGRLDAAEALVRGRPLDDLGDAPIALPLRARLERSIDAARLSRLQQAVDDDPLGAIAELASLVVGQPLVESWWRLLMLAEYRTGRPADALRTYQRARTEFAEQLGVEPSPALTRLEHKILHHDPDLTDPGPSFRSGEPSPVAGRRPPAPVGSFVGRADDLAALESAVATHRLVTLVGPGGVGKTTISLELARRVDPEASRWLALAPLADREAIVRCLAAAVGLPESDRGVPGTIAPHVDPLDRVVDVLAHRRSLLVIDNCEHVIEHVAAVVHRVLADCPDVRVVATSRELLGVPGEHLYPLGPLPPDDAVALFRACAERHGVSVGRSDLARVRSLCEHLDGLPLAIELAAARLRTMTVSSLLDGLSDRFNLLSRGARTVDPRQRSLRAVVDWSHDLLDPVDQVVFRRLAAFVGGCDAGAASSVCAGGGIGQASIPAPEVDAALERLVDKSLVIATPGRTGMRFHLLETLGAYARERLIDAGELEPTLVRHAQYYADTVRPARRGLLGSTQQEWFARIGTERQNIEAALDTALAGADAQLALELVTPLGWYFFMTGELAQGSEMLGDALACAGPAEVELRAAALAYHGWLAANGPNVERAVAITSEAVSLLDRVDDPWTRALIANMHAMSQFFAGRLDTVERSLDDNRRLAEASGDEWMMAITKVVTGEIRQFRGDTLAAEEEYIGAAEMFDHVGDRFAYALAITEASEIAEQFGHYDRAVEMLERGIALADEVGFSSHPSAMRARLGNIEVLRGNLDAAERHHRSLIDDEIAAGVPWLQAMARFGLSMIARRRDRLDVAEHHLDRAWELPRSQSVPYLRSLLLVGKGFLADQRGDAAGALEFQRAALTTTDQLRTPRGTAYALEGCAGALALVADPQAAALAARMLGHADRLRRESGSAMPGPERFDVDRAERRLRETLGPDFDDEFDVGVTMDTGALIEAAHRFSVA